MSNGSSEIEMVWVEVKEDTITRIRLDYPTKYTINLDNSTNDRVPIALNNGVGVFNVPSKNFRYMFVIHQSIN